MKFATQRVVVRGLGAAMLAVVGCADGSVNPVSPSGSERGRVIPLAIREVDVIVPEPGGDSQATSIDNPGA